MKKFASFCAGVVFLFFLSIIPITPAYASELSTFEKPSFDTRHGVNDYIPVKAIQVDDSFPTNINPVPVSSLRMARSKAINASPASSDFYKNWGRTQLALTEDGEDKVALYDFFSTTFANVSNTKAEPATVGGDVYYIMFTLSLSPFTITVDDAQAVYSIFRNEHPEYYWLYYGVLYRPTIGGNVHTFYVVTTSDYDTPKERENTDSKVKKKLDEYRLAVSKSTTNYEIAKKVHDKIITDIDYLNDNEGNPSLELYAHNIVGILDGTGGVCEGYAKAFQYILNKLNIPNLYIPGYAGWSDNYGGHAWNMAMADNGQFYYVDATWDDLGEDGISYDYFMSGSTFFDLEHFPNKTSDVGFEYLYPLPVVPAENYNSYENYSYIPITTTAYTISNTTYVYDGKPKEPEVKIDGLKKDVDYTVYYNNNIDAGVATIYIIGKGKYKDSITHNFTINKANFSGVTARNISATYDGKSRSLSVNVPKGSTILYSRDNKIFSLTTFSYSNVGAYKIYYQVINKNYNGTAAGSATITITRKSINQLSAKLPSGSMLYNGIQLKPKVSIPGLTSSKDFKVTYKNNIYPGTAIVTITGISNYTGSITRTFTIVKGNIAKLSSIKLSSSNYTYKGTALTPSVTIKNGSKTLVKNKDYKVTYSNHTNPGTATVKITGIGYYSGTIKKTFTIKLGTPTLKVTSRSHKASLSWNKVNSVTGYEVFMSTSASGKYTLIKNASSYTTKYTKSNLTRSKTYYFKARTYKIIKGKKVYGSFSAIKQIKIK